MKLGEGNKKQEEEPKEAKDEAEIQPVPIFLPRPPAKSSNSQNSQKESRLSHRPLKIMRLLWKRPGTRPELQASRLNWLPKG